MRKKKKKLGVGGTFSHVFVDLYCSLPKQQKKFSLKHASEGYIGKLQLLKSGKARYENSGIQWDYVVLVFQLKVPFGNLR